VQIRSSTFSTLPVPVNRRDELADRRQGDRRQPDVAAQTAASATEREITRIRPRANPETQRADNGVSAFADLLANGRSRAAILAYSSNGPSIEERLGVELVGVDVYA